MRVRPAAAALVFIAAAASAAPPPMWTGPYVDVSLGLAPETTPGRVVIWAFATGECGRERWAEGVDTEAFAAAHVKAFVEAKRDYVISTGGEAGVFTCDGEEAMLRFVERYRSPHLVGIDFDIEGKQTPEQIDALVRSAAAAHARWPQLRFSFTLATHAASDGSGRSLNATGEAVLRSIRAARFDAAMINLMVMNYGPPDARWCVPAKGRRANTCDMGRSALQAVRNVQRRHGIAPSRIALTLMLGENDVAGNVTRPDDAARIVRGARAMGLAGVHYWSLHRDKPCPEGSPRVSPRCHALEGVPPGRFGQILR